VLKSSNFVENLFLMELLIPLLENARKASRSMRQLSDKQKKTLLQAISLRLIEDAAEILFENQNDLAQMLETNPMRDRLLLNQERIKALADAVLQVSVLEDPTGHVLSEKMMENGLMVQKKTVPLGVVGTIYESRPNVTVDVAALCLRSGNVCLLRGGTEAYYTNTILVKIIQDVLQINGLDPFAVQLVPTDRKFILEMLTAEKYIDVIIPRGSQQLINYVRENARVPVIETGAGVCHTYVEAAADLDKALAIVVNAKVSRPSVCNALDTVLIDAHIAQIFIKRLAPEFLKYKIEIFADAPTFQILNQLGYPFLQMAGPEDFGREFLDLKCSIKIVAGMDEALDHIQQFSSRHSEAIVSENEQKCTLFMNEVDAAAVYANASTRFTDGAVFGLGSEIGISTQKLHARGPFALEKLVTEKWFVTGNGQVRI
jgi:glutamate-5-semialdehyde dehydrogenase